MVSRKTMLVVKVDGDGDCLFHSLGFLLGTGETSGTLRKRLINFMEKVAVDKLGWRSEPYLEEAGTLRAGAWGGNTALIAFSEMMGVRVTVHTKEPGKDVAVKEWSHESVSDHSTAETYHLLFNGRDHYDALREVDYRPDAMQAAWEQPPPPAYVAPKPIVDAFPALQATGAGQDVCRKRTSFKRFTAPRPSRKGKAKKPVVKEAAAAPGGDEEMGDTNGAEEDSDPEKGRNRLLEELQAIPVAETSQHPHRHVEDLVKDGLITGSRSSCGCILWNSTYFSSLRRELRRSAFQNR